MSVYHSDSDAVWVGILSASIGHYLNHPTDDKTLRQTYRDFLKSPIGASMDYLPPLPRAGGVPSSPSPRPRAFLGGRR